MHDDSTVRGLPRSHDSQKSLSVIYHICQMRLEMIIEGDLNLRALPFVRPLILVKRENVLVTLPKDGENVLSGKESMSMRVSKNVMIVTIMTCAISSTGSIRIRSSISFLAVSLLPVSFYLSLPHIYLFPQSNNVLVFISVHSSPFSLLLPILHFPHFATSIFYCAGYKV